MAAVRDRELTSSGSSHSSTKPKKASKQHLKMAEEIVREVYADLEKRYVTSLFVVVCCIVCFQVLFFIRSKHLTVCVCVCLSRVSRVSLYLH